MADNPLPGPLKGKLFEDYPAEDIDKAGWRGWFAYVFFPVSFLQGGDNEYVMFHVRQGVGIFIIAVIINILTSIVYALSVLNLITTVFFVCGIINSWRCREYRALPFIGEILEDKLKGVIKTSKGKAADAEGGE